MLKTVKINIYFLSHFYSIYSSDYSSHNRNIAAKLNEVLGPLKYMNLRLAPKQEIDWADGQKHQIRV